MNCSQDHYSRFEDWSSVSSAQKHSSKLRPSSEGKLIFNSVERGIRNGFEKGSERVQSLTRSLCVHPLSDEQEKVSRSKRIILDPQGTSLQRWNKIFVLSCIISVSVDPLFFYTPIVDGTKHCFDLDRTLMITAIVLRSFTDLFYVLHIIFQFRTGFISPPSRVFGRGELIEKPWAIAKRYITSYFIIDVLAVLPFPQVLILAISPNLRSPIHLITKGLLKVVIFCQYFPRFLRIIPLTKEVTRNSGLFTETAWAGAAFNLFLYILASHIHGAFWYLFSVERQDRCWRIACGENKCDVNTLYCGKKRDGDYAFLNTSCPFLGPDDIKTSKDFNFGMYVDALRSRVVEHKAFLPKLFYCLWWGLRNLSSLGQNLKTSNIVLENIFAIYVSIVGLVLFSSLIGNMQKYLKSITRRVEEMRVRKQDAEQWMSHRRLPENLKGRIRRYEQYKWQETRGVEEEAVISNLPKDLRRDIKRHLFWDLLKRVPMFEKVDEQLLDAMCDRFKPVLYTKNSLIVREGDPVDRMIFIMRGHLLTMTTNGGRSGFFNSVDLKGGDFCGDELLTWALDPNSSSSLPTSTRTVKAVTDVEAFALMADNLKSVASQFRRLNSKQLQHTFRFYSQQWRTWAASFIQVAWRQHCRRNLEKALWEKENRLQAALAKEGGSSPSLGATIYASKFAVNALRLLRRNQPGNAKMSQKLPPLPLQKPPEPDFSAEDQLR